ncbi:hypothetical protein HY029_03195 [Candidatus Gottesmanbacteria bacterium]|nr:hypothetical protein [Candidatus Gottesmanbacteria bacterium]
MLSKKDFDKFEELIKQVVDDELDKKIPNYIKYLPTKDEFYSKMDELMGEVKSMRETQEIHSESHRQINDRLEKLETILEPQN